MATKRKGLTARQARTARGMRRDLARLSAGESGGRTSGLARAMQGDMARLSGLTGRGVTKASGGSDRS